MLTDEQKKAYADYIRDGNNYGNYLVPCQTDDEICKQGSLFGDQLFGLTREDIQYLLDGGILGHLSEYGTFLKVVD